MSKRDKRPPSPPDPALDGSRGSHGLAIESLIASGKAREALDLAKQLVQGDAERRGRGARHRRLRGPHRAMLGQGLYDEATALAALVGERFPAHRHRIGPLVSQSKAVAAGDLQTLLAELALGRAAATAGDRGDPGARAERPAPARRRRRPRRPAIPAARRGGGERSVRRGDEWPAGRGGPRRAGPDLAPLAAGAVEAPDPGARRVLPARGRGGARQPRRDSAPRGPGATRARAASPARRARRLRTSGRPRSAPWSRAVSGGRPIRRHHLCAWSVRSRRRTPRTAVAP